MVLLQIIAAYFYSHFVEYIAHIFLHKFKKKDQLLSFHLREHHVTAKRNSMKDDPSLREAFFLTLLTFTHLPLAYFAPYAFLTLLLCAWSYLYVHYRAHSDLEWAEKNVPWHVDHHLGNQQANWGVRKDWFDRLFKTRKSRSSNAKRHEQKTC